MRLKLYLLFFGILLTFIGEIKADEICYYSNYQEFKKCKKGKQKYLPKYPIDNFHSEAWAMGPRINTIEQALVGNIHEVVEFQALSKSELQITNGKKSIGLMGLGWRRPWISRNSYIINPQNIFFLENKIINSGREYSLKYIDSYGELKSIKFEAILFGKKRSYDILGDYLRYASKLRIGEEKSIDSIREKALKENEKFLSITKSIIRKYNNSSNNCFVAKESKFPELTARYKNLYRTINPLRAKLDLPPSSDLKPICN